MEIKKCSNETKFIFWRGEGKVKVDRKATGLNTLCIKYSFEFVTMSM